MRCANHGTVRVVEHIEDHLILRRLLRDSETPGGFKVVDGKGITVAWVYARDDLAARTGGEGWLTSEEAWRIANGIAKLPTLLVRS